MAAIAITTIYVVVSVALGGIWVARDFTLPPDWELVLEFLVVALGWPLLLALFVIFLLATRPKKHDGGERASRGAATG